MRNLIVVMSLLSISVSLKAQWYPVNSGTTGIITDMYFVDSLLGFGAAENSILITNDGGENWTVLHQDSIIRFGKVIVKGDTAYVYGEIPGSGPQYILKSEITQNQWQSQTCPYQLIHWQGHDGSIYFATPDALIRTSSFVGFDTLAVLSGGGVHSFVINPDLISILDGYSLEIHNSVNGGATWDIHKIQSTALTPNSFTWFDFAAFSDTIIIKASYPAVMVVSVDTGNSWSSYHGGPGFESKIVNPEIIYGIAISPNSNSQMLFTNNTGQSWEIQDSLDFNSTVDVRGLYFLNKRIGFIYGADGKIYKTTNGGGTVGLKNTEPLAQSFHLYPNPSQGVIHLSWPPNHTVSEVAITDLAGRKVKSYEKAIHTIHLDGLGPGIYLLSVTTDAGMETRKFFIE